MVYHIYIQYQIIGRLKIGAKVKTNGKVIGEVISFMHNPNALIVEIAIRKEIKIPLLSSFKIIKGFWSNDYIEVEYSNDKRFIRENEYFSGTE